MEAQPLQMAFLYTGIAGSTRLAARLGDKYTEVLKKITTKLVSKHEIKGSKLIISTDKPQKLFHELFTILENKKENIQHNLTSPDAFQILVSFFQ